MGHGAWRWGGTSCLSPGLNSLRLSSMALLSESFLKDVVLCCPPSCPQHQAWHCHLLLPTNASERHTTRVISRQRTSAGLCVFAQKKAAQVGTSSTHDRQAAWAGRERGGCVAPWSGVAVTAVSQSLLSVTEHVWQRARALLSRKPWPGAWMRGQETVRGQVSPPLPPHPSPGVTCVSRLPRASVVTAGPLKARHGPSPRPQEEAVTPGEPKCGVDVTAESLGPGGEVPHLSAGLGRVLTVLQDTGLWSRTR